jgi:hypothetical protein
MRTSADRVAAEVQTREGGPDLPRSNAAGYVNAGMPVMALPRISVWISFVPS